MSRSSFAPLSELSGANSQVERSTLPTSSAEFEWHRSPSPATPQQHIFCLYGVSPLETPHLSVTSPNLTSPNGLSSLGTNTSPNRPLPSPQSFFGYPVASRHQEALEFYQTACDFYDKYVLPHEEKNDFAEMITVVADAFVALCDVIEQLIHELEKTNKNENAIIKAYDTCCVEMSLFRRDIADFQSQVSSFNPSPK